MNAERRTQNAKRFFLLSALCLLHSQICVSAFVAGICESIMKPDIKALALEKKFGEIETAIYTDRSLIGDLVALLAEKNGDVRSGALNLLSRVGFDYPNDTRTHLPTLIALLDDPDMFIKIDAANAVGNLGFSFKDAAAKAVSAAKEHASAK